MSHCHDEHHGHDHDHSEGAHDHSDDITPALQSLLYEQIDFDAIRTLNEKKSGSGADVTRKTWAQRLEADTKLESDADWQLLMTVPFTGQVRLHSILLRSSNSDSAPKTLKVYINKDDIDFDTVDGDNTLKPTQTFELSQTSDIQELPVQRAKFNSTQSLSLFFQDNFGDDEDESTEVFYLGFKGDFMKLNKEGVNVLYEAQANPADHKAIVGTKQGMDSYLGGPGSGS